MKELRVNDTIHSVFKQKCKENGVTMVNTIEALMQHFVDNVKVKKMKQKGLKRSWEDKDKIVRDVFYIKRIQKVIIKLDLPLQVNIIEALKEKNMGKVLVSRVLRDYDGIEWSSRTYIHENGGRPTKVYKLIRG